MPHRKYLLIILVLLWGCSPKKNTWLSRNFQGLVSHYNIYFNGKESYKAGIKAIEEANEDNFTKVLPMFEESDENAVSVASSNMDRAIEKGTKLIVRHSITVKPKKKPGSTTKKDFYNKKDYNKWVDDALLLIGKAQAVKHDYGQAVRTFNLLINDFPNEESKYEALIWKARAYTEMKDFNNAGIVLETYDLDGKAPESLYGKYMEVYANLLLSQNKYSEAIPILQSAINEINKKDDKARYSFILGQIKELTGDETGAALAYGRSLKYHPDYEMAFNAQLRRAAIVYKDASLDEIKKQIRKLLRDKKNEEFRDQIYYALGKVYLNYEDVPEAIKSFKKSVEVSVSNDYQKTLSYLAIADIYFDMEKFKPAYTYYDSTMTVISEDYKDYKDINERYTILKLLVKQLDIIDRNDSLLMIADMSEPERNRFIDNIIESEKKRLAEEQKLQRKDNSDLIYTGGGSYQSSNIMTNEGKWYFYNPTTKEMGKQEFLQRWGNRKLTDNWRRSNKGTSDVSEVAPEEAPGEPGMPPSDNTQLPEGQNAKNANVPASNKPQKQSIPTREELLADIPLTKEVYDETELMKDISMYEAGMIFLERLHNYPKAIEMFEGCLMSKVFSDKDKEKVYIALYKAYDASEDNVGKQNAFAGLKQQFPESKFIQYIEDPDFLKKIQDEEKRKDDEYANTYALYLTGNYDMVIEKASMIEKNDSSNIYLSKYMLIKALSYARKGETDQFKQDLEDITSKYPGTQEAKMSSSFLKMLADGRTPVKSDKPYVSLLDKRIMVSNKESKDTAEAKPDISGFKYSEVEKHDVIVLPPAGSDINRMVFNLADFNFSRYLLNDYGIETSRLPDNSPVVIVEGFNNKLEGMDYFYAVREHENEMFHADSAKTKLFAISESNLKFFLSSGQINNYEEFFNKLYLTAVDINNLPPEVVKDTIAKEKTLVPEPVIPAISEKSALEQEVTAEETQEPKTTKEEPQKQESQQTVKKEPAAPVTAAEPVSKKDTTVLAKKEQPAQPENKETEKPPVDTAVAAKAEQQPQKEIKPESPWVFNADAGQNVMVIFAKSRMDYNKILKIYTNYTRINFAEDDLKVEMQDILEDYKCIYISGFKDVEEAEKYAVSITRNSFLTRNIQYKEYYIWVITQENRTTLVKNKDLKGYDEFYKKEYLKK